MKTSKFTDSQIMSILKQAESGTPIATLCREHGMRVMRLSTSGVLNMAVWMPH